jgi:hypothetical protein
MKCITPSSDLPKVGDPDIGSFGNLLYGESSVFSELFSR